MKKPPTPPPGSTYDAQARAVAALAEASAAVAAFGSSLEREPPPYLDDVPGMLEDVRGIMHNLSVASSILGCELPAVAP